MISELAALALISGFWIPDHAMPLCATLSGMTVDVDGLGALKSVGAKTQMSPRT
ncbi:hypothetical protein LP7551_04667 [Roseibium album]|nr:hypothetical protein LP7551_04667 [Roseibium album]